MASLLTEEDKLMLKEVFEEIDVDGKGNISMEKLFNEMDLDEMGPGVFVIAAMFDTNGDGMINFEEFQEMAVKGLKGDFSAEQMFKIFDKNGDGFITCDEAKKLMLTFGEDVSDAEANEFIEKGDKDGDGKLNFEEFKAFKAAFDDDSDD